MIQLEIEEEIAEDDPNHAPVFPGNAMFEYSRFGEKIMVFPHNEIYVKECISGRIVNKKLVRPFRRDDKGNFYYKLKTDPTPVSDASYDLFPSTWEEDEE